MSNVEMVRPISPPSIPGEKKLTWRRLLPTVATLFKDGSPDASREAYGHLILMAQAADNWNAYVAACKVSEELDTRDAEGTQNAGGGGDMSDDALKQPLAETVTVLITFTERVTYSDYVEMPREEFLALEGGLDEGGRAARTAAETISDKVNREQNWQSADEADIEEFHLVDPITLEQIDG